MSETPWEMARGGKLGTSEVVVPCHRVARTPEVEGSRYAHLTDTPDPPPARAPGAGAAQTRDAVHGGLHVTSSPRLRLPWHPLPPRLSACRGGRRGGPSTRHLGFPRRTPRSTPVELRRKASLGRPLGATLRFHEPRARGGQNPLPRRRRQRAPLPEGPGEHRRDQSGRQASY